MHLRRNLTHALFALAFLSGGALATERPIHVGALIATSGPAAFIGASERNALEMLVKQKNAQGGLAGHMIELTVYDTEGNATKAAQLARRLVEVDKVDLVMGPSTTGESLVVKPVMEEAEVPLIAFASGEKVVFPTSPYIFKTPPTDRVVLGHMFDYFAKHGIKSVGVLYANDGYGQGAANLMPEIAKAHGIAIKAMESHSPKDTDYTPQLLTLRNSDADALFYWGNNPGPTLFVRGAKALGVTQPLFNGYAAATEEFISQSGAAAEGTYVSSMHLLARGSLKPDGRITQAVTKLADDYKASFGTYPATFAGHPNDAVLILEAALKKINGDFDAKSLRDAIETVELPGANGYFKFSPQNYNGLDATSGSMIMLKVQNGHYVPAE